MINERLKGLSVKLDDLTLDQRNARKHNEKSVNGVAESLRLFGQQKPIVVDEAGVVIAGNATVRAARSLGWTSVAAVSFVGTKDQKTAFAIADNRTAELSEWNPDVLLEQISELSEDFDLDLLGLSSSEVADLMNVPDLDPGENSFEIDGAEFMTVKLTPEQADVVRRAVDMVKEVGGVTELSYARGIELICADYLGG